MTTKQFIRPGQAMTRVARCCWIVALLTTSSIGLSPATQAAGYNPITHQAQSKLATLGFNPGTLDGIQGNNTSAAIQAYQRQAGLPATGQLDSATLDKLSIGISVDKAIEDWRALPTQIELDRTLSNSVNDPNHPYTDYRPYAPAANLDLPGKAILAAMHSSADTFGSRRPGQPKHSKQGYEYMAGCLKTQYAPTHWSDLTIHYYCQMSKPRACYTYATSGKSTGGVPLSRTDAYRGCVSGKSSQSADFAWVAKNQPLVFQYVMYGQTHAFDHEQEQAIINAFYGVLDPADRSECKAKRPRRTEDPTDGTHCQVNKTMRQTLVGRNR